MGSYLTERHQKVTVPTCNLEGIQLYQGVPQGTVFRSLLFNIYVNDMQQTTENCSLLQNADGTMIFSSQSDAKQAVQKLNSNVKTLIEFFESRRLTIETDKTEVIFCKSNSNPKFKSIKLSVRDQEINVSQSIKYLGVLDQNLIYQDEVKNILLKMARGKKLFTLPRFLSNQNTSASSQCISPQSFTLYSIFIKRNFGRFTDNTGKTNSGVKACFNRNEYDHSSDLKLNYNILPVQNFLDITAIKYYWKNKKSNDFNFAIELYIPPLK